MLIATPSMLIATPLFYETYLHLNVLSILPRNSHLTRSSLGRKKWSNGASTAPLGWEETAARDQVLKELTDEELEFLTKVTREVETRRMQLVQARTQKLIGAPDKGPPAGIVKLAHIRPREPQ